MTEEQLNTIKNLVTQINTIADDQQNNGVDDFGTLRGGDEPILLFFKEYSDGWFVGVYDGFAQSTLDVIEKPLTQLPAILLLVKENIDILDAVALVQVREALRLLEEKNADLDVMEQRTIKRALFSLQFIKRQLIPPPPPVKRAVDPTFDGFAEPVKDDKL